MISFIRGVKELKATTSFVTVMIAVSTGFMMSVSGCMRVEKHRDLAAHPNYARFAGNDSFNKEQVKSYIRSRKCRKGDAYAILFEDKNDNGKLEEGEIYDAGDGRINLSTTEFLVFPWHKTSFFSMTYGIYGDYVPSDCTITDSKGNIVWRAGFVQLLKVYSVCPFSKLSGIVTEFPIWIGAIDNDSSIFEIGPIIRSAVKKYPGEYTFVFRTRKGKHTLQKKLSFFVEESILKDISNSLMSRLKLEILFGKFRDFNKDGILSDSEIDVIGDLPVDLNQTGVCVSAAKEIPFNVTVWSPDGEKVYEKEAASGTTPLYMGEGQTEYNAYFGVRMKSLEEAIRRNSGKYIFVIEQGFDTVTKEIDFMALSEKFK